MKEMIRSIQTTTAFQTTKTQILTETVVQMPRKLDIQTTTLMGKLMEQESMQMELLQIAMAIPRQQIQITMH